MIHMSMHAMEGMEALGDSVEGVLEAFHDSPGFQGSLLIKGVLEAFV